MSQKPLNTAVLLVAFNRPDVTARVFERIRKARPTRLYVAVDGPRSSHGQDAALCAEVRRIVSTIDWPCELNTLFREHNLGCKNGVSSAIDWFFEHEQEGIILEDDCLPSLSFFRFCETLLPRFKTDARIFAIQGNFFGTSETADTSYLFSKHFYMWGWATWADRWKSVDVHQPDGDKVRQALKRDKWLGSSFITQTYWLEILGRHAAGCIDSWGYSVVFHCFANKLFNVTPTANLVMNIGLGEDATRTAGMSFGPLHAQASELRFPLVDSEPYRGAAELLPFEDRWRIQVSRWRLLKRLLSGKFPRAYRFSATLIRAAWPRSSAG
ncbi:MAG: hypothetical protein JSU95_08635 [Betaproteobacteria bacterium]|nr:MAG: hypothetical protein JSU95_08635 [Betaproteobacteria bacterium]